MKVWTTRSGQVLHATRTCPGLQGVEVFGLDGEQDALPHATRCSRPVCEVAFRRQEAKAA